MTNKPDLSNEKWILLHKIPKEDILEFILNHEFEWFRKNLNWRFYQVEYNEHSFGNLED